jgi:hypothetical protein
MLTNKKQIGELAQRVAHSQSAALTTKCVNQDQQPSSENFPLTSSSVADLPDWVSTETLDRVRALIGSGSPKA